MLASRWWHYDRELSSKQRADTDALEKVARTSLQSVIDRPKLSTVQGGLLLLQFRGSSNGAWALSAQLVAVAQELGLDATCADWAIPAWEKGLRSRLGWTIFMMDKWYVFLCLVYGALLRLWKGWRCVRAALHTSSTRTGHPTLQLKTTSGKFKMTKKTI